MTTTSNLPHELVLLAQKEVGTEEVNGTNCGPRVNEYKSATNLPPNESWPWCAAFICWLVREGLKATGIQETEHFHRPKTAGAWDFINWSRSQDGSTWTLLSPGEDIKAGDILVYTFSHIGLAVGNAHDGVVPTIEGNTDAAGSREGGGVFRKVRPVSKVRARIRFTL